MYHQDIWMSREMVDRHKGIATESSFSLAMYRWAKLIIEFLGVVHKMDDIGINEFEAKITKMQAFKTDIETKLAKRSQDGPRMLFRELRGRQEVTE